MIVRVYSNYHNINYNDKILHDGKLIFESGLEGFEAYEISVNDASSKALITSKYSSGDGTQKNIIGKLDEIERGNIITINATNERWLIISKPEDNKIYRKATIQLCNSTYLLPGTITKVQSGINDFGDPIYEFVESDPTPLPCIAETTISSDDTDEAINLPEGQLQITISFTEHDDIKEGKNFKMYGSDYQIIGIDHTKSIDGIGLLVFKGKKV